MDEISQIFDRVFKRIFTFSDKAITNLINGLFDTDYPPDSQIEYSNRENTKADLKHSYSDLFIVINKKWHYHLEAQMYHDNTIVMRVFEYGFYHALETREDDCTLRFPEPVVVYFCNSADVPETSSIRVILPNKQEFMYTVKNFAYLAHGMEELNRKKMIVFIPFQMVRVRDFLMPDGKARFLTENEIQELKKFIDSDILGSIKANLEVGNITLDDYKESRAMQNRTLYDGAAYVHTRYASTDILQSVTGASEQAIPADSAAVSEERGRQGDSSPQTSRDGEWKRRAVKLWPGRKIA
ncbi:MAG: hypothetical protein LUD12_06880 [Lachnospiraceae bacterium]|nr:hypothetical protein [Lachnospiraceae bacterium]